jgi:uncharacterized membrane protein
MVLSFDSLRVVALYGWVKGSILGAVIWLQPGGHCFALVNAFLFVWREEPENAIFEDVEAHIIYIS